MQEQKCETTTKLYFYKSERTTRLIQIKNTCHILGISCLTSVYVLIVQMSFCRDGSKLLLKIYFLPINRKLKFSAIASSFQVNF